MKTPNSYILFILLSTLLIVLLFFDLLCGTITVPSDFVFSLINGNAEQTDWYQILLNYRIPKTITALLAGASLSVSGLQMQTVFRNPLAGPYILGISAGSSLGIVFVLSGLSLFVSLQFTAGSNWLIILSAWIGSAVVLILLFLISLRIKDIMTVLIFGVLFSSIAFAVINILQYFSTAPALKSYLIWTMGSLNSTTWQQLYILLPCVLSGILISLFSCKMLNVLLLGERYAEASGLHISRARIVVFLSTSLLTGTVTAFCGPIGFVGIIVPHITRMLFRSANHFIILPGSLLTGCIILLISDIISQLPQDFALPVNSVTALIGIPVIVWIILRNRKFASV